jgi:hypothetical protein
VAVGVQVVFDCADPARLGEFWASALGYVVQPPPSGFASWPDFLRAQNIPESDWNRFNALVDPDGRGPRLFFQQVPESKTTKNRVHLDVNAGHANVDSTVERLVAAGATKVHVKEERGERWVVMQDPEGNEFCVQ